MSTLKSSGFTTVILWTIHVDGVSEDLTLNDKLVASRERTSATRTGRASSRPSGNHRRR